MSGIGFDGFKVQISRFTDRTLNNHLGKVKRKFFNRTGGAIRLTAKRSLRKAPQKKLNELTREERIRFRIEQSKFKRGKRKTKPRRPDRIAAPGKPPLLHMKKSPLKELIFFYTDQRGESVLIGPSQFNGGNLKRLEAGNPFMAPALKTIEPRMPEYLAGARQ